MVGEEADSIVGTLMESVGMRTIGFTILLKIYFSFSTWRSMEDEDRCGDSELSLSVNSSMEGLDLLTGMGETGP